MSKKAKTETPDAQKPSVSIPEKETAGISWLGLVSFAVAIVLFLAIALVPGNFFRSAKTVALENLDTHFGSALFLAGAVSFIAFAASQYWRFLEARREFYVVSNRAQAEQDARNYKRNERLYDAHQRSCAVIQAYSFPLDSYKVALELSDEDFTLLQKAVDELVRRATGPDRKFGEIQQSHLDRLSKFRGFLVSRSLGSFVSVLEETSSIPKELASKVLKFLDLNRETKPGEAKSLLKEMGADVSKLPVMAP